MLELPMVKVSVTEAVPTAVELVLSRKWVGSLLVSVNCSLAGAAPGSDRLPKVVIMLLPTVVAPMVIAEPVMLKVLLVAPVKPVLEAASV